MLRLVISFVGVFILSACQPGVAPPPAAPVAAPQTSAPEPELSDRDRARLFVSVVEQVEPVAELECRNRSTGINCDFWIVVDDDPDAPLNAFQTVDDDGRPIIVFTLALIQDARNADELAFILAHEAAHHIKNHLEEQRRNAVLGAAVFGELAGAMGGEGDAVRSAQEFGAVAGARTFSKEFELEADRLGTIIAGRAGYDPVKGSEFFFRVPDPGDVFLGTHPPNAERIAIVRQTAARFGL